MKPYYEAQGVTLFVGDCLELLPQIEAVDHVLTDPPYARDVYQRLGLPKTKQGSGTPARLSGGAYAYSSAAARRGGAVRAGIKNHQYSSASIERLAAGAIGNIDEMLEGVAQQVGRLVRRWALVFSDVETCHRWRSALELAGLRYVRTGAWVKTDPMPQFSGDRPAVGFEPCTLAHAQGPMRWNGGGLPAVWTYGTVKRNRPGRWVCDCTRRASWDSPASREKGTGEDRIKDGSSSSTGWSGKPPTDRFLRDGKSTTPTETNSTTELRTSSCLPHESTNGGISDTNVARGSGGSPAGGVVSSNLSTESIGMNDEDFSRDRARASPAGFGQLSPQSNCDVCGQRPVFESFPSPKPLALMTELVRLFTDPGETILDPFAGSGTTLVAARNEGRLGVGIEIDEAFAEVAARRLERGDEGARWPDQGMFDLGAVS